MPSRRSPAALPSGACATVAIDLAGVPVPGLFLVLCRETLA